MSQLVIELINQSVTEVFVEQHLALPGSAKDGVGAGAGASPWLGCQ